MPCLGSALFGPTLSGNSSIVWVNRSVEPAKNRARFGSAFARWAFVMLATVTFVNLTNDAVRAQQPSVGKSAAQGPTVAESLDSLVVHEGIQIAVAANEPNVVDPVALRFDELGRMWVVEMRDYPTGPADGEPFSGQIRVLKDVNQDGHFESATTFASELVFPTGVQPWRDGVIVTLAGSIEFMADRDGDGRCDHREVWFEGFEQGNEQLRANHPTLGPDGRVYVANGLRGGSVVAVDSRWSQRTSPVRLRGKDFAFDPRGGFFGAVAGNSQFGMSMDDFGRRVGCSNRNPAFETLFDLEGLSQDRWSSPADAMHDIAFSASQSTVRAIADTWTTSHTHAGQFSAACGVTVGLGTALPKSWRGDLVVCEPTSYAVQRQQIDRLPVGRRAMRVPQDREMVSSRDSWFRPVDTTMGPDGALYIVDMCRAVIEHPNWAPNELKKRPDERWGNRRGRIWRVAAPDQSGFFQSGSGQRPTTVSEWCDWLDHPNVTQRQWATRQLLERDRKQVAGAIVDQILSRSSTTEAGYARALWLLHYHHALSFKMLQDAAKHASPNVRRLAMGLLKRSISGSDQIDSSETDLSFSVEKIADELSVSIGMLLSDHDEWVKFDCVSLCSAIERHLTSDEARSRFSSAIERELVMVLHQLIERESLSVYWRRQLACLSPHLAKCLLDDLLIDNAGKFTGEVQRSAIRNLARVIAIHQIPLSDEPMPNRKALDALAFAAGWIEARQLSKLALRPPSDGSVLRCLELACSSAEATVSDARAGLDSRQDSLDVLRAFDLPRRNVLFDLLKSNANEDLRVIALKDLLRMRDNVTLAWLSEHISASSPRLRSIAIDQCIQSNQSAALVLDWIDEKRLSVNLVSLQQRERLKAHRDKPTAQRASKLFVSARADRLAVIREYESATLGEADLPAGLGLFKQHCASCHRVADVGIAVGPDISDSRTKTPSALLAAILDPNAAIDAGYLGYQVLLDDGRVLTGMLTSNEGDRLAIKLAGGETRVISRDNIELFKATGNSLMPAGFERNLDVDSMRNLIGYLKGWRYLSDNQTTLDLSTTATSNP